MNKFPKKIHTERLTIKKVPATIAAAQEIFNSVEANRTYLEPWLCWVPETLRVEDSYNSLREFSLKNNEAHYGIFFKNKYIGNIGIFKIDLSRGVGEIGYWLSQNKTGNGYVKEAVLAIEEAFVKKGIHKFYITCDSDNLASAGVAKGCGYKQEGCLKNDGRIPFGPKKGQFRDTLIFGKEKS